MGPGWGVDIQMLPRAGPGATSGCCFFISTAHPSLVPVALHMTNPVICPDSATTTTTSTHTPARISVAVLLAPVPRHPHPKDPELHQFRGSLTPGCPLKTPPPQSCLQLLPAIEALALEDRALSLPQAPSVAKCALGCPSQRPPAACSTHTALVPSAGQL